MLSSSFIERIMVIDVVELTYFVPFWLFRLVSLKNNGRVAVTLQAGMDQNNYLES